MSNLVSEKLHSRDSLDLLFLPVDISLLEQEIAAFVDVYGLANAPDNFSSSDIPSWEKAELLAAKLSRFGVTGFGCGTYRVVLYIGELWVIKIPALPQFSIANESERRVYARCSDEDKRHFAKSLFLRGGVIIQRFFGIDDDLFKDNIDEIERVAARWGCYDIHDDNVGWNQGTFVIYDYVEPDVARKLHSFRSKLIHSQKNRRAV